MAVGLDAGGKRNSLKNPALIERAKTDNTVMEDLLPEAEKLIWLVVWRYIGGPERYFNLGITKEDLLQTGLIGFIKAVRGFDAARGNDFTTYAVPMIWGEIRRFVRDYGYAVHTPRKFKDAIYKVVQTQQKDPNATIDQIAERTGLARSVVEEILQFSAEMISLDEPLSDYDGMTVADAISASMDVEDEAIAKADLDNSLNWLNPKYKKVIQLKLEGYTQDEVSQALQISQPQVSRILKHFKEVMSMRSQYNHVIQEVVSALRAGQDVSKIWERYPDVKKSTRGWILKKARGLVGEAPQDVPQETFAQKTEYPVYFRVKKNTGAKQAAEFLRSAATFIESIPSEDVDLRIVVGMNERGA